MNKMNQLKKGILVAFVVLGLGFAQAQEVAHIDVAEVLNLMPETKTANDELTKLTDGFQVEIKKMESEIEGIVKQLEPYNSKDPATITPAEREKIQGMAKTYQEKMQKMQSFQQEAAQSVQQTRERLLKPIEKKIQDAINASAAKKGVKYVVDANRVLYYNGGYNLLEDVKKELGI